MSASLYSQDILRLTTQIPYSRRLDHPMITVERRSPICGSKITVDLDLDQAGHVVAFGQDVRACALGQASAALLGKDVLGKTGEDLAAVSRGLAAWLSRESDDLPEWPGLEVFTAARDYPSRHAAICLPFEAAAAATQMESFG
jgi:NifU-like protein involved in Fe-S cluster formation